MIQILKINFILFVVGISVLMVNGCANNDQKHKRPSHANVNVNRNKTVSPVVVNQSVTKDNHSSKKAVINKKNSNSGQSGAVSKLKPEKQPQTPSSKATNVAAKSQKANTTLKTNKQTQNTEENSGQ